MRIYTLWGVRPEKEGQLYGPHLSAASSQELLMAWDEYAVDENPDGFENAMAAAVEANGGVGPGKGLETVRVIILTVPDSAIHKAFEVPEVEASVEENDE